MTTLNQALEIIQQLPHDQQEMLIQILQHRLQDNRRNEIAADAEVSLAEYHREELHPQTATEIILALRQSLQDPQL
ncbi:MAG: hypothetical protein HC924_16880 [Synechococcaceae cyanobacterium SM2_3_2]|nr:hypothetical protein [Synechococcaceae cyanobacterium SM2_3_2]